MDEFKIIFKQNHDVIYENKSYNLADIVTKFIATIKKKYSGGK